MQDLIFEYKRALQEARKMYKPFQQQEVAEKDKKVLSAQQLDDKKLISGMISDLEFTIDWLESGRLPGAKRGFDRRDSYQRMIFKDPRMMHAFASVSNKDDESAVTAVDLERIEDALSVLTKREKEMFLLNKVQLYSYEEIADLLNVKKSTVQTNMKRAGLKMSKRMSESLFCLA
jgi:RNA polymerase sigma factor (sigma-70 family)